MSKWKTVASSATTPVENKTRKKVSVAESPCAHAKITSKANEHTPPDRSRTTIGVGELIHLEFSLGEATWTTTHGTLSLSTGTKINFDAPDRAASVTITAKRSGCTSSIIFSVIEPDSVMMIRDTNTNVSHENKIPSIGMKLNIYILPATVSYKNISILEDDCVGVVTGYFVKTPLDGIHHAGHGAGVWVNVGSVVGKNGSKVIGQDTAQSGYANFGEPYQDGTFEWAIPWKFRVNLGPEKVFSTVRQRFIIDSKGTMTVEKGGAHASALINDPSHNY